MMMPQSRVPATCALTPVIQGRAEKPGDGAHQPGAGIISTIAGLLSPAMKPRDKHHGQVALHYLHNAVEMIPCVRSMQLDEH